MTVHRHRTALALLTAALLAGCAGSAGGIRPLIALDGDRMELEDPGGNGRALLVTGQYGLAIDALSRVLHDDPRNLRALNLIAEAYDRLHRYDLGDRYHAQALEIDPNSVAALNNWGFSYLLRGDKVRAVALLQRAEAVKGDQPVVLANLRLATGDDAAPSKDLASKPPAIDDAREIRISEHVTMVRQSTKLVRLAPGVQMLVTTAPELQPAQQVASRATMSSAEIPPLPYIVTRQEPSEAESRTRNLAALQRLLDPSPFGFFPEIDDFNLAGSASAAVLRPSIATAHVRLAG